jgi:hypothetical protein
MARTKGAVTKAPMKPSQARYRIWRSMRILRRFTIPQLAATAEAGVENVRAFVYKLIAHGYARRCAPRRIGVLGSHNVYMLFHDTGPKPPKIHHDGTIFDPNHVKSLHIKGN